MELKANELRIGNYLNYQGKIIKVEGIHNRTIYHSDRQFDQVGVEKYITFEPIPLTEEWLLRFGFEKEHVTVNDIIINIYRLGDYEISIYLQGNETQKGYYLPHSLQSRAYIKYVHQIQNLYFSLTNNELKLIK